MKTPVQTPEDRKAMASLKERTSTQQTAIERQNLQLTLSRVTEAHQTLIMKLCEVLTADWTVENEITTRREITRAIAHSLHISI